MCWFIFEWFQRDQAKQQCLYPFILQGSWNMEEISIWYELPQLWQRMGAPESLCGVTQQPKILDQFNIRKKQWEKLLHFWFSLISDPDLLWSYLSLKYFWKYLILANFYQKGNEKQREGVTTFFLPLWGKKPAKSSLASFPTFFFPQKERCLCREIDPVWFFSWNVPSSSLHAPYIPAIYYMMWKSVSQKINTLEPAVASSWGVLKWVLIWREKGD